MLDVTTEGFWTPRTVEVFKGAVRYNARQNFQVYRKALRPKMLESWWTNQVAEALQQFYEDLIAGRRPRLAIGAPPQHGKSWAATDFMSWVEHRAGFTRRAQAAVPAARRFCRVVVISVWDCACYREAPAVGMFCLRRRRHDR
jgi:hypothetical protein